MQSREFTLLASRYFLLFFVFFFFRFSLRNDRMTKPFVRPAGGGRSMTMIILGSLCVVVALLYLFVLAGATHGTGGERDNHSKQDSHISSGNQEQQEVVPHGDVNSAGWRNEVDIKSAAPTPAPQPAAEVAVMVLLAKNPKSGDDNLRSTIEGLAVLRRSAEMAMALPPVVDNRTEDFAAALASNPVAAGDEFHIFSYTRQYRIHFVALVMADVDTKWHSVIRRCGFDVKIVKQPPVLPSEVRNPQIAKELVTDGAMGVAEMAKLEALRATEYSSVVLVDCDVFFHRNFEELFAIRESLGWTHGGWKEERINGGYLVFNPHQEGQKHFDAICDILREGDFRSGTGWRGSGIGWVYGGRTIQGLLPYYYFAVLNASTHREIDRCRYNNMVQLAKCKAYRPEQVSSNHFTGDCVKPWWCPSTSNMHPLCKHFNTRWHAVAADVAKRRFGVNGYSACGLLGRYSGFTS